MSWAGEGVVGSAVACLASLSLAGAAGCEDRAERDVEALVRRGDDLLALGLRDVAREAYREATTLAPDHRGAWLGLEACLAGTSGRSERAQVCETIARRFPGDARPVRQRELERRLEEWDWDGALGLVDTLGVGASRDEAAALETTRHWVVGERGPALALRLDFTSPLDETWRVSHPLVLARSRGILQWRQPLGAGAQAWRPCPYAGGSFRLGFDVRVARLVYAGGLSFGLWRLPGGAAEVPARGAPGADRVVVGFSGAGASDNAGGITEVNASLVGVAGGKGFGDSSSSQFLSFRPATRYRVELRYVAPRRELRAEFREEGSDEAYLRFRVPVAEPFEAGTWCLGFTAPRGIEGDLSGVVVGEVDNVSLSLPGDEVPGSPAEPPEAPWPAAHRVYASGELEAALALYESAPPEDGVSGLGRVLALARLGRAAEADALLEALHRRNPQEVDNHLGTFAYLLEGLPGLLGAAGEACRSARQAKTYAEARRYPEALAHMDKAIQRWPNPVWFHDRGLYRLMEGDAAGAAEDLDRAVRGRPDDERFRYNHACALARAGRPVEALDALEAAVGLGWSDAAQTEADADLETLRGEARFRALLDRMRGGARGD